MTAQYEISMLEKRKEVVLYSRKVTTCISNVIVFDQEIAEIDRRLEKLKK